MAFALEKVVPWGRSLDEYAAMFALTEEDLSLKVLDCGGGPASFNAVLTARGGEVISVDPIYAFSSDEIRNRVRETYDEVLGQTRKNASEFVWRHFLSADELGEARMAAMNAFLADFAEGVSEGRYVEGELPTLPFQNQVFDLALCSHFLFLYSDQFTLEFHYQSIKELCRLAGDVRIFPILELGARRSRHIDAVITRLDGDGHHVSIKTVPYEFQKGGNEMLQVKAIAS